MTLVFDPHAKDNTTRVYHGTRASAALIREVGLMYPGKEMLLQMIRKSMELAGMSYDGWYTNQIKMEREGKLCTLEEFTRKYRSKIWVTASEENAWSYARRSPEIVTEALLHEFTRINYRRKNVIDQANKVTDAATAWMGKPIVIVVDAKAIGAGNGCNQPIGEFIFPDQIVSILETPRS